VFQTYYPWGQTHIPRSHVSVAKQPRPVSASATWVLSASTAATQCCKERWLNGGFILAADCSPMLHHHVVLLATAPSPKIFWYR
jgi:hypothetical protein